MEQTTQTQIIVLKGDLDLHEAAADQLLRLIDGKDNYSLDDMSPIETVIVRRMLSAVKGGRVTIPDKKVEKLPDDIASGYSVVPTTQAKFVPRPVQSAPETCAKDSGVTDLQTPATGLISASPIQRKFAAAIDQHSFKRLDGKPWHKSTKGLYDRRTGSICLRGYGRSDIATLVAQMAEGGVTAQDCQAAGLSMSLPTTYEQDAELVRRLPYGDARYRWLALRFGFGGAPDAKPDVTKISAVTRALIVNDQAQALRLLGVTA